MGAVPQKDVKPILCNIKIVANKKQGVVLHATDTWMGVRIPASAEVIEKGECLVPAKQFYQCLKASKQTAFTLESVPHTESNYYKIVLSDGVTQQEFITNDPDKMPNVAAFAAESYHEILCDDLQKAITRTVFAADKNNVTYP